jgi:hypothetical protein
MLLWQSGSSRRPRWEQERMRLLIRLAVDPFTESGVRDSALWTCTSHMLPMARIQAWWTPSTATDTFHFQKPPHSCPSRGWHHGSGAHYPSMLLLGCHKARASSANSFLHFSSPSQRLCRLSRLPCSAASAPAAANNTQAVTCTVVGQPYLQEAVNPVMCILWVRSMLV